MTTVVCHQSYRWRNERLATISSTRAGLEQVLESSQDSSSLQIQIGSPDTEGAASALS